MPEDLVLFAETRDLSPKVSFIAVPWAFREKVIGWRPHLGEHEGLMAFFQHVLFGRHVGKRGGIVIDERTVYNTFGVEPWRDTSAEELIGLYRRAVDPHLKIRDPYNPKGWAREVTGHGIPKELVEAKRAFVREVLDDPVYLINGKKANDRNRKIRFQKAKEEAEDVDLVIPALGAALKIRGYLHGLPARLFTVTRRRIPEAHSLVEEHPELFQGRKVPAWVLQEDAHIMLKNISEQPVPLYAPSDYSPRLKAYGKNQLLNLKSELRHVLYCERDVELDLSKAHLAGLAKVGREAGLDTELIDDYLRAHESGEIDLWTELAEATSAEDLGAARKAVKRLYAGVYGGGENEILRVVSNKYSDLTPGEHPGFDPFRPLLGHELVRCILDVKGGLIQRIKEETGGMRDAYGRFLELEDFSGRKNPARSLLSYVVCSYELRLIEAAFDVAIKEKERAAEEESRRARFHIWLLQYDGFTVRVKREEGKESVVRRLQEAVDERAEELGIITHLERKYG